MRLLGSLPPRRQPPKSVPPLRRPEVASCLEMTLTATVPALKEWSAAVHALLDGRQHVLLRKGGIGEKRFEVAAQEFLLFPTVAHSHAERVRPEHRDLLAPAEGDSTLGDPRRGEIVAALEVNRPDRLEVIEDLHIWTAERGPTGSTSGPSTSLPCWWCR